jgi:hypothetical protein
VTVTPHGQVVPEAAWPGAPFDSFPANTTSQALASSLVVATGQRRLFGLQGYNSNAAAQFVLIFDTDTLPADGALATLVIKAAAVDNFSAYFGSTGRWFDRGIVLCNSTTEPTKTIGAADCFFDVQYY